VDARIRRGGSNPYGPIWILTLKRIDAEGLQQRKEVNDQKALLRAKVKKEELSLVGQYPELGKRTAKLIANSSLIELPDVGHIPHLEAPEPFHKELLKFLKAG
jgi:pimeloyl-ACP methyl ester carboxylesterase